MIKLAAADTIGKRFGRIVVLERTSLKKALCQCDCGTRRELDIYGIAYGRTKSCGCLHRERLDGIGAERRSHGLSASREYRAWFMARRRCYNPRDKAYSHYGERGIEMCPSWRDDFEAFFRDMGECPAGFTLERSNVDEGYAPGNCCWIPQYKQAANKRNNVRIEWSGENLTIAEWSRKLGIGQKTLSYRYHAGLPLEAVFSTKSLKARDKALRDLPAGHRKLKERMAA